MHEWEKYPLTDKLALYQWWRQRASAQEVQPNSIPQGESRGLEITPAESVMRYPESSHDNRLPRAAPSPKSRLDPRAPVFETSTGATNLLNTAYSINLTDGGIPMSREFSSAQGHDRERGFAMDRSQSSNQGVDYELAMPMDRAASSTQDVRYHAQPMERADSLSRDRYMTYF